MATFAEELRLRRKLIDIGKRAVALGFVMYHQGNFSIRLPETDHILIKPTSIPYEEIELEDIVKVDLNGNIVDGLHKPSSEVLTHCMAYRKYPKVGACAHVESPYLNALYAMDKDVPNVLGNFVYLFEGKGLATGPSLRSNSEKFAKATLDAMGDQYGVIWKNHGVFCVGPTLEVAFDRCVAAEQAARVYWLTLALKAGEPSLIPPEVQDEMVEAIRSGKGGG
ncbi:MAG: class II aldolase/adducin family protein [Chloroflexi bacterium]|nr:class II aldolase/adducin family protein [Chloroflexota bacterium]